MDDKTFWSLYNEYKDFLLTEYGNCPLSTRNGGREFHNSDRLKKSLEYKKNNPIRPKWGMTQERSLKIAESWYRQVLWIESIEDCLLFDRS